MQIKHHRRDEAQPLLTEQDIEPTDDWMGATVQLITILNRASITYTSEGCIDAETDRPAADPKLQAASMVVFGLLKFLQAIDQGQGADARLQPALALAKALRDLADGRSPPEWFKRHKRADRGGDPLELWHSRALAAAMLRRLIDTGVPQAEAEEAVFRIIKGRGLGERGRQTAYRWLRSFDPKAREKDRAPKQVVAVYTQILVDVSQLLQPSTTRQEAIKLGQEHLAKRLDRIGFFLRTPPHSTRRKPKP